MSEDLHRYLFIVRMRFNEGPVIDSFYKLESPSGMSGDEVKMMTVLKPGWESESLKADTTALQCMSLRIRFNSDMYQKVCLVRSTVELKAEDLETYIVLKHKEGDLDNFLKESAV